MEKTRTVEPDEDQDPQHDPNIARKLYLDEAVPEAARDCKPDVQTPDEPSQRWQQDTQPVDGEAAIDPPPGSELIQRSRVQG